MPSYNYIYVKSDQSSGATIFDRKIISELRKFYNVNDIGLHLEGRKICPLWAQNVDMTHCRFAEKNINIVSHESIAHISEIIDVQVLLIHNFFCSLEGSNFVRRAAYKFGSKYYFRKIFAKVKKVVFISHHDYSAAFLMIPEYSHKYSLVIPGCVENITINEKRIKKDIYFTGSSDWNLKRKGYYFTKRIISDIGVAITRNANKSYISVITDDFTVGFKLKLLELAAHQTRIISFANLEKEIASLELPVSFRLVNNKRTFLDAYSEFVQLGDYDLEEKYNIISCIQNYTWSKYRDELEKLD